MADKSIIKNLQTEIDASYLYRLLGELEENEDIKKVFHNLSAIEGKHAQAFEKKMKAEGDTELKIGPSRRAKILGWIARHFGSQLIMPLLINLEKGISNALIQEKVKRGK